MSSHIILIGGLYGAGKTTLGRYLHGRLGTSASFVNFDTLGDDQGVNSIPSKVRWDLFLPEIQRQVYDGYHYVIADASFYKRETRDHFMDALSESALVSGLFLMLPMKEVVCRLHQRIEHSGGITANNYVENVCRFNREFMTQNNSDLLLPKDRSAISHEYKVEMSRCPENQFILDHPENDQSLNSRWLVVTETFNPNRYVELLRRKMSESYELRCGLESETSLPSRARR